MYLIVIDAHSKWPEIIDFGINTKASTLIEEFSTLFARFGLPLHMVTDNGPQFRSAQFKDFLARNGVHVSFSAPYHPATNGAAENFLQTFIDKVTKIVKGGESVEVAIKMFLFDYRGIPHTTTGQSLAYLMYGRNLRTRFDVLRPNVAKTVDEKQKAQITAGSGNRTADLCANDDVMIDNYRECGDKRVSGQIVKQTSPSTFIVRDEHDNVQKRHVDQIIKRNNSPDALRRSPRLHLNV